MPEETSLKRNTDDEVLPQGYSTELADWKEVIVDEEGKQYVRDTEVLAKLTEMDNKLQTLENTVDEDGNQKVTQYGNNVAAKLRNFDKDSGLDPGSSEVTEVFSDEDNTIEEIKSIEFRIEAPDGATEGDHNLLIGLNTASSYIICYIEVDYNEEIRFTRGILVEGDYEFSSDDGFMRVLQSTLIDDDTSLYIRYRNRTDVTQENERQIRIHTKSEGGYQ